jgi:hypothetical protein
MPALRPLRALPALLLLLSATATLLNYAAATAAAAANAAADDDVDIPEWCLPLLKEQENQEKHISNVATDVDVRGGAVAYSLPVPLPHGPGSMRPELSIDYSNSGADGVLGVGFKISATSLISRCAKTLAQDGKTEGVK